MSNRLKPLTLRRLALSNLSRRASRTAGLIAFVSVLAFILFAGTVLTQSMNGALASIGDRFGADLIVVPQGNDEKLKGILLQGSPSFFYLDRDILEAVKGVEGVAQATPQFFLTSVGADCCSMPVQIIGFDPETDFVIKPWIAEVYSETLQDGEVIVGSDITAYENGTVRFYDENYRVAAQLAKTGTGLDQAVYGNWNTLVSIFETATNKKAARTEKPSLSLLFE